LNLFGLRDLRFPDMALQQLGLTNQINYLTIYIIDPTCKTVACRTNIPNINFNA